MDVPTHCGSLGLSFVTRAEPNPKKKLEYGTFSHLAGPDSFSDTMYTFISRHAPVHVYESSQLGI